MNNKIFQQDLLLSKIKFTNLNFGMPLNIEVIPADHIVHTVHGPITNAHENYKVYGALNILILSIFHKRLVTIKTISLANKIDFFHTTIVFSISPNYLGR